MKLAIIAALLFCVTSAHCQFTAANDNLLPETVTFNHILQNPGAVESPIKGKIKIDHPDRWRLDGNKLLTGGLLFLSGAAKGFNETLWFHWGFFHLKFPKANPQWFNPVFSSTNKYKGGDPHNGAKFPLSTSVLVMFTDQYHLNNFINRGCITAAIAIKIGEKKKPLKQYLLDALYYTAAYQAGWGLMYWPFKAHD